MTKKRKRAKSRMELRRAQDFAVLAAADNAVQLWPLDESEPPYSRPPRLRLGDKGKGFFPPILGQDTDPKS